MREKLNDNPVAQIALVAVLLLLGGIFLLKSMGGGEESEAESVAPPVAGAEEAAASGLEAATPTASSTTVETPTARSLPDPVEAAYARGDTIALLIHRSGGIDDRLLEDATKVLDRMPEVALFTVPAKKIAGYAPITGPLGVNQAPALVVISPRQDNGDGPATGSVTYGFHGSADIRQAIVDAGYRGPELSYAPD